jgi:hypothetical protein
MEAMTPTTLRFSSDQDTWSDGKVRTLTYIFSAL